MEEGFYGMDFVIIEQKYTKNRAKPAKFLAKCYKIVQKVPVLGRFLPVWPKPEPMFLVDSSKLQIDTGPVVINNEPSLNDITYRAYMYYGVGLDPTPANIIKNTL